MSNLNFDDYSDVLSVTDHTDSFNSSVGSSTSLNSRTIDVEAESACLQTLKTLFRHLYLPIQLNSLADITPNVLIALLESILQQRIPNIHRRNKSEPLSAEQNQKNMKIMLGVLQVDILQMELPGIDIYELARGGRNESAIELVEVLWRVWKMIKKRKISDGNEVSHSNRFLERRQLDEPISPTRPLSQAYSLTSESKSGQASPESSLSSPTENPHLKTSTPVVITQRPPTSPTTKVKSSILTRSQPSISIPQRHSPSPLRSPTSKEGSHVLSPPQSPRKSTPSAGASVSSSIDADAFKQLIREKGQTLFDGDNRNFLRLQAMERRRLMDEYAEGTEELVIPESPEFEESDWEDLDDSMRNSTAKNNERNYKEDPYYFTDSDGLRGDEDNDEDFLADLTGRKRDQDWDDESFSGGASPRLEQIREVSNWKNTRRDKTGGSFSRPLSEPTEPQSFLKIKVKGGPQRQNNDMDDFIGTRRGIATSTAGIKARTQTEDPKSRPKTPELRSETETNNNSMSSQATFRTPSVLSIQSHDSPFTRALKKRRADLLRAQYKIFESDKAKQQELKDKLEKAKRGLADAKGVPKRSAPLRYEAAEASTESFSAPFIRGEEGGREKRKRGLSGLGTPVRREEKRSHRLADESNSNLDDSSLFLPEDGKTDSDISLDFAGVEQGELLQLAEYIEFKMPGVKLPARFKETLRDQQVQRWKRGMEHARKEEVLKKKKELEKHNLSNRKALDLLKRGITERAEKMLELDRLAESRAQKAHLLEQHRQAVRISKARKDRKDEIDRIEMKRKGKEEMIVQDLYKDLLKAHDSTVRDLKKKLRHMDAEEEHSAEVEHDAEEQFLRDQIEMLEQQILETHEKNEVAVKAQTLLLAQLHREQKEALKQEISKIRMKLDGKHEDVFYREVEADIIRKKILGT